jgi:hypothetical protein
MGQALPIEQPQQQAEPPKLETLKNQVSASMDLLDDARRESQKDQDYYDDKQWTDDEVRVLEARNQPALVFNHIKPAVNAIIGIKERGRVDPKAWGRTPKDQKASEVATDSLRYVDDLNRFSTIKRESLKTFLIWGIVGGMVEVDQDREIRIKPFRPEEYYYDPYSRDYDFADARYDGLAKWMDEDAIIELYPDQAQAITSSIDTASSVTETYKDRPNRAWSWADKQKRRVLVFEHYHLWKGEWCKTVFVSGAILEHGPSQYKDSKGRPKKCTVAQSAYVDRDNRRYGVVRSMRGPQDAINKARSKAVHLLNVRQVRLDPGIQDADEVRHEIAKPDGVVMAREGQVEPLNTHTQFMPAHLELLRDAKDEMRRQSPTPGIVGRNNASQSGVAIQREQEAGLAEHTPVLASFDDWLLRMYRSMWEGVKQFWDGPKFVRVTDDENAPKFMIMNARDPQTGQPFVDPQTGQPMEANSPAEMDMDIIIDTSMDVAVLEQEQFRVLAELMQMAVQSGQPMPIPFAALIKASSLPKKQDIIDAMEQQQPDPKAAEAAEIGKRQAIAKIQVDETKALKTKAETEKIATEIDHAEHVTHGLKIDNAQQMIWPKAMPQPEAGGASGSIH